MRKILRVGILGMGNMGKAHANSMMKMEDVKLVGLCSSPIDDAQKFSEENSLDCPVFDDGHKMIEETEMDILYICLPPFGHDGQLEAAAKKGIHIFIEKPIAINLERGRSMVKAVKENKVFTQVGYHMRFGGAVKKFKEYLNDGTAGKPTLYMANYECNSLHGPWWRDITKCGGQVFEQVIHLYDMSLYLLGEACRVNGYVANLCHQDVEGYTIEDTSVSNIRFKNGALGSISGSNCSIKNQWSGRFRVICENMVADFTDHNNAEFTFTKDENVRIEQVSEDVDAMFEEDYYFIGTVRGNRKPMADIVEGFQGLQLVSAVVKSSGEEGATITL